MPLAPVAGVRDAAARHLREGFIAPVQTADGIVDAGVEPGGAEGELVQDSVVKDSFTTAADGKNYATRFYNLDAIISVGYRVKSAVATRFRIWATRLLREYIVKGFLLDDERLKNPDLPFDYFEDAVGHGPQLAPGEPVAERDSFGEVVAVGRLREATGRLSPVIWCHPSPLGCQRAGRPFPAFLF